MLDKNGVEIKTGDIVEISGAYFKNDNGLYFVTHSPGDPTWSGRDYSLKRISKYGKISKAKYNLCFWPISVFVSDRFKAAQATSWNREHATIEVKPPCKNMSEVIAFSRHRQPSWLRAFAGALGIWESPTPVSSEKKLCWRTIQPWLKP